MTMPTIYNFICICNLVSLVRSPLAHMLISLKGRFFETDTEDITWSVVSTGRSVYEMAQLQNQQLFSENENGQAEWGQIYFATTQVR